MSSELQPLGQQAGLPHGRRRTPTQQFKQTQTAIQTKSTPPQPSKFTLVPTMTQDPNTHVQIQTHETPWPASHASTEEALLHKREYLCLFLDLDTLRQQIINPDEPWGDSGSQRLTQRLALHCRRNAMEAKLILDDVEETEDRHEGQEGQGGQEDQETPSTPPPNASLNASPNLPIKTDILDMYLVPAAVVPGEHGLSFRLDLSDGSVEFQMHLSPKRIKRPTEATSTPQED